MQRDDMQDPSDDQADELRRRIAGQVSDEPAAGTPAPSADPVQPAPFPSDGGWGHSPDYFPGPEDIPGYQPPAPAPPPPAPAPPPAAPDSSSTGAGIPWAPGASAPSSAPAGYHWDANMANFVADTPTPAATNPGTGARPSGGMLTDPGFAAQYVAWAGTQPGVNPSVRNDPGYWIGRFTSGAFGNDQNYALKRMMQAEGAPEGAATAPQSARITTPGAPMGGSITAPSSFSSISGGSASGPQGVWNSDFVAQLRQMIMQRLGEASTPVDPNDPNITATMSAARDEASRTSDKERTALAENLYANGGLNTDAIGQKIQQSGEKNATSLASLRSTLITRELQSKQDELKSLLQMALQSGDAESAQAIQLQLAELSAQVQREGIGADLAKYQGYLNALGSEQVMN